MTDDEIEEIRKRIADRTAGVATCERLLDALEAARRERDTFEAAARSFREKHADTITERDEARRRVAELERALCDANRRIQCVNPAHETHKGRHRVANS